VLQSTMKSIIKRKVLENFSNILKLEVNKFTWFF
jgi:hypothetical protein